MTDIVPTSSSLPVVATDGVALLVDNWLATMAESTRRSYRGHLRLFAAAYGQTTAEAVAGLLAGRRGQAKAALVDHQGKLLAAGMAPASINTRIAALVSLLHHASEVEVIQWAAPRIRAVPAATYRDTRGPGAEAIREMLRAAGRQPSPLAERDVALVVLLGARAFRSHEVRHLLASDVDLPGRQVKLLRKGKRERAWEPLGDGATAALAAWLQVRDAVLAERDAESEFVFFSLSASSWSPQLSRTAPWKICKRVAFAAGLDPDRVWPHGLRHTGITESARAGNAHATARYAGHSKVTTSQKYIDNLTDLAAATAADVEALILPATRRAPEPPPTPEGGA